MALYDPALRNLSAERIYNLIAEDEDGDSAGGDGNGSTNSGSGDPSAQEDEKGTSAPKVPATNGGFGQVIYNLQSMGGNSKLHRNGKESVLLYERCMKQHAPTSICLTRGKDATLSSFPAPPIRSVV